MATNEQRNVQVSEKLWQEMKLFIATRDSNRAARTIQAGEPRFTRTSISEFIREAIEAHLTNEKSREQMLAQGLLRE